MQIAELKQLLQRIHEVLQQHQSEHAEYLQELIALCDSDEQRLYSELNSRRFWGGAGSVANEALADNPGIDEWLWQSEIQMFREIMIELGQYLMARGESYPDISSWLLAYNNWNQSAK